MYAIIGATGNIGSKTADILLDQGETVRVIGRSALRLQRFIDKGAEAAVGDLRDTEFLADAFSGTTTVFAMIPPDYRAGDFRIYQNEIGLSIANAIKTSRARFVVNLSSQGAHLSRGTGPILGLRDQEERLNQLPGVNILHLRPTYFMENLLLNIPLIYEQGVAGSAVRGDLKIAMIATCDIAAHLAERMVRRNFEGKSTQDLLGQRDVSHTEAVAAIGRKIGKPELKYVQFPYDEVTKRMMQIGFTSDVTRVFVEMYQALNDGLFAVNCPRTPGNTTPTTIEDFAETFAKAYAEFTMQQGL